MSKGLSELREGEREHHRTDEEERDCGGQVGEVNDRAVLALALMQPRPGPYLAVPHAYRTPAQVRERDRERQRETPAQVRARERERQRETLRRCERERERERDLRR